MLITKNKVNYYNEHAALERIKRAFSKIDYLHIAL